MKTLLLTLPQCQECLAQLEYEAGSMAVSQLEGPAHAVVVHPRIGPKCVHAGQRFRLPLTVMELEECKDADRAGS